MSNITKTDKILEHLQKYGSITSLEAIEMYSATRLSSIIYSLRHNGYNIITEKIPFVDKFGTKTYYGRYFLKESN